MTLSEINEQIARIQGLILALCLLDTYPSDYDRRMKSAFHAMHSTLEDQLKSLSKKVDQLEADTA